MAAKDFELRKAGATLQAIADTLGLESRQQVHTDKTLDLQADLASSLALRITELRAKRLGLNGHSKVAGTQRDGQPAPPPPSPYDLSRLNLQQLEALDEIYRIAESGG